MLSSEMRACDILHQDQPKRKLRTAIENTPSGQLLIANNTPLSSVTRGQRLTFTLLPLKIIIQDDRTQQVASCSEICQQMT